MGIFKEILNHMNESTNTNGIPEICRFNLFGNEYSLKTQVVAYISDEHSKELYDLFLSSLSLIEGGLRSFISSHYSDCIAFFCEGLPLPDEQDSEEYSDIKLLIDEWNAQNMVNGGLFDETAAKGLESLIRLLVPHEIHIEKDYVFLGVFANKFNSEGYEVIIKNDGVNVDFWE